MNTQHSTNRRQQTYDMVKIKFTHPASKTCWRCHHTALSVMRLQCVTSTALTHMLHGRNQTLLSESPSRSVQFSCSKATRFEQSLPDLRPPALGKDAYYRSESIPLGQGDVIEIKRTFRRHSFVLCYHDLCFQSSNCARRRSYYDFVQRVECLVASQNQHRSPLIRRTEDIPADFPAVQVNCSQPSASQESKSSSAWNSSGPGGIAV